MEKLTVSVASSILGGLILWWLTGSDPQPPSYDPPSSASVCMSAAGSCPMLHSVSTGSASFCQTYLGPVPGVAY